MTKDLKIVKLPNKNNGKFIELDDKEMENISYLFDEKSGEDLLFDIEIGENYELRNFGFK